ncbi:MAG: cation diffusion facilitator family transporter [Pyrinomonadaceae bacterium]
MSEHIEALVPGDKIDSLNHAKRHELWSLFFLFTIVVLLGFTMGSSQAMKAMWIEDTISLVPTTAVLLGIYFRYWEPDRNFNYGYHRAVQIGFLAASVALFGFGLYLLVDSVYSLLIGHHPTIQTVEIFGYRVWLGWLMIAALVYSVIPPFVLGRMKEPLAKELHDKTLYASATIDKGDWLAGIAAIFGITGIALGYWWADSVAAGLISLEITKDGISNLKNSVFQLMNMRPTDVANKENDPIYEKVESEIKHLPWVRDVHVRLREDGPILAGEAFVVPEENSYTLDQLADAGDRVRALDWRLQDFNIVLVRSVNGDAKERASSAAG